MKKFCSKCGNQLDLGKKACSSCHAFNPFFIAGFNTTTEPEPPVKIEIQEEPIQNKTGFENEAARLERDSIEQNLKTELLKVKEKTEQYKKETLDLVKGVQKELHDIDIENKLLKEKVESLKNNQPAEHLEIAAPPVAKNSSNNVMAIAAIMLLIVATGVSYMVFHHAATSTSNQVSNAQSAPTSTPASRANAKNVSADSTAAPHKLLAAVSSPTPKPASALAMPAAKPNATPFSLTTAKVTGDLVGKKLSGCDITIKNSSEIEHVDNLVLVDQLSATYLKYKCTVKIKQGTEEYTASPYMYYSADGTFIKVDGTNCE